MNPIWRTIEYTEACYEQLKTVAKFVEKEMPLQILLTYTSMSGFVGSYEYGPHRQCISSVNKTNTVGLVAMFDEAGKSLARWRDVCDEFKEFCLPNEWTHSFRREELAEGDGHRGQICSCSGQNV